MKFLLQTNNGEIDEVEVFNARNLIQNSRGLHEYLLMDYSELKETKEYLGDWIPIGTLEYVRTWLKKYKGIEEMKPIEVPEILREEKYLGRSYDIVSFEDLELKGYKFIKDIDKLKQFSFTGDLGNLDKNDESICSKVGTTTRTVQERIREELRSDTYKKMGAVRCIIHRVYDCGEIPAEGLESMFRATYIRKYPNSFHKNDRFIKQKFDLAEADKICKGYLCVA